MIDKQNKKGVSAIVATSLIILITVAAISIVWTIVLPMIRNNLQSSQACLEATGSVGIRTSTGKTCYSTADGKVYVQIERSSANIDITSLNLKAIDSEGNAQNNNKDVSSVDDFGTGGLNPGDVYIYSQLSESGNPIVAFEIVPVITVGTQEYSCNDAVASAEVDECVVDA